VSVVMAWDRGHPAPATPPPSSYVRRAPPE
jgi:hypothetical protein